MRDKRCVHLDFHTSELVPGIGSRFNREEFKQSLIKAGIDSITLFAKCHHGCFYYEDTKFFKHPYLERSLLDEQVAVCKELGISYKIYLSAGYDEYYANRNHDFANLWKPEHKPDFGTNYAVLCFNTPYMDRLVEQTQEVVKKYMPDGVFYDIATTRICYCPYCLADRKKKGLDSNKKSDVWKHAQDVYKTYLERIDKAVKEIKPDCMVFHNSGSFSMDGNDQTPYCDQLEVESLPTGGWGYDYFPLMMSYVRRKGKNCIGMTGKFHRTWGEFGGYKYKEALMYEAAQCMAFDAGLCVGDQLHATGKMDLYTYEMIGEANAYIAEREQWRGGTPIVEMALLSLENNDARKGAGRILFEEKYLFDMIGEDEISSQYKVIVVCDNQPLSEKACKALQEYAKNGGKMIVVGESINTEFAKALDFGCTYIGEDTQKPAYFKTKYALKVADGVPLVMKENAYNIEVKENGEILAEKISPYRNRTTFEFCSHCYFPCDYEKVSPSITEGENGIYIAGDIFTNYAVDGSLTAKQIVFPLIDKLLGERTVRTSLPSSGKCIVYKKNGNILCHLLYANTMKRGDGIEVIEDIVTLSSVKTTIKCDKKPEIVVERPTGKPLSFTYENGVVSFEVNNFHCYDIVEICF